MAERDTEAMNATGWHLCLDVLAATWRATPSNGGSAPMRWGSGWESLRDGYSELLGAP